MRIPLSPSMTHSATRAVFAALEAAGGEACVRFVGGCVRNALMGRPESDLDLSTRLSPDEVEAALKVANIRSVPTGKAFGTITAVVESTPYEITSLREDVETDGRRAVVRYTQDWTKDAERRDFYINALYADKDGAVFDPTGHGLSDAEARRVRFIGEASQRIREDYLRILRFFRFTAGYASTIDQASYAACVALKSGIDSLSGERISQELLKLLELSDPTSVVSAMVDGGIMDHVLPGAAWRSPAMPVFKAMTALTDAPHLRLAALLDDGQRLTFEAISALQQRLRFSNALSASLKLICEVAPKLEAASDDAHLWRTLVYHYGREGVADAVWLAAARAGLTQAQAEDRIERFVTLPAVPVFPLKGADLIRQGLSAGPEVGERLKAIEARWIDHDFSQSVINQALDDIASANRK